MGFLKIIQNPTRQHMVILASRISSTMPFWLPKAIKPAWLHSAKQWIWKILSYLPFVKILIIDFISFKNYRKREFWNIFWYFSHNQIETKLIFQILKIEIFQVISIVLWVCHYKEMKAKVSQPQTDSCKCAFDAVEWMISVLSWCSFSWKHEFSRSALEIFVIFGPKPNHFHENLTKLHRIQFILYVRTAFLLGTNRQFFLKFQEKQ